MKKTILVITIFILNLIANDCQIVQENGDYNVVSFLKSSCKNKEINCECFKLNLEALDKYCSSGDSKSCTSLSSLYLDDEEKAFEYSKKACEIGVKNKEYQAHGCQNVGLIYINRFHNKNNMTDKIEAVYYFRKACDLRNAKDDPSMSVACHYHKELSK